MRQVAGCDFSILREYVIGPDLWSYLVAGTCLDFYSLDLVLLSFSFHLPRRVHDVEVVPLFPPSSTSSHHRSRHSTLTTTFFFQLLPHAHVLPLVA
jgi:hypothetical protein